MARKNGREAGGGVRMTNAAVSVTFARMASDSEFAARGKVIAVKDDGKIVFAPSNTNYQLHLQAARPYDGPKDELILAVIRAKAKKVYTVPSGGGFISPIFGPPKTIQGRALQVDDQKVVIRAGVPIVVELPRADDALDLQEGPITVGSIVNAVAMAGATFEFLSPAAAPAGARK
jgi:hypothetical protein